MLAAKSVWEPAASCGWEESLVLTPLPASSWKVTADLVVGRSQLFPFSSSRDLKSIPSEVGPWEEEGQFFLSVCCQSQKALGGGFASLRHLKHFSQALEENRA